LTRRCSCCWRSRSERRLTVALAALALASLTARAAGPCSDCGSVEGTIAVQQAAIRGDGPKHDRDVVLYLEPAGGGGFPPVDARAEMDQKGLVFVPHVLAVRKGATVTFLNSDNEQHNVYFLDDRTGETLDIGTWGPGVSVDHRFESAGVMITLCKLHLEMAAFVVVVDTPYFTTVQLDAADGTSRFAIRGVPPGRYRLHVWHKKLRQKGGAVDLAVAAGSAARAEVVITKARYAGGPG